MNHLAGQDFASAPAYQHGCQEILKVSALAVIVLESCGAQPCLWQVHGLVRLRKYLGACKFSYLHSKIYNLTLFTHTQSQNASC